MADRRVKVVFEAEIAGYKRAMQEAADATQKAKKSAEDTGKSADTMMGRMVESATKNKEEWQQVGTTIAGVGAATVAGVGLAVKTYADFDKAMSGVQAATHESTQNMDLLREAAIAAGADTAFSAEEAALGIEELAKAGVSTADVLAGGLDGALALAAAGELEVGAAAEIAASAMTQFGLEGSKIPHIADLLAAGAGKAQGSVHDMGMALNQVGLVANQTGLTIEETTGGLAAFASAGLVGSDAGTSFKSMLQRLNPQSKEAQKLTEELGISAYDASGEFVGLSEYAGLLQGALKDMAPEQRNAAMQTLFGADAVRAASVLYENGAAGVEKWESAVTDAGYAAETAALLQDNLAGDLEKLGGSFDTVMLQSGSGANEVLRGFVQGLEDVIDTIGKIPAPILSAGTMIAGVLGGAALLGGGLITVVPKILETKAAFDLLAPAGGKADKALRGVAKGAAAAGAIAAVGYAVAKIAESGYMKDLHEGGGHIAKALQEISSEGPGAATALDQIFKDRNGDGITTQISDLDSAIDYLFSDDPGQKFNLWGQDVMNSLTGIKGGKQIAEDTFRGIDAEISAMVTSGSVDEAKTAFDTIKQKLIDSGVGAEEAAALFPQYEDALARAAAEQATAESTGADAAQTIEDVGTAAEQAAEQADGLVESLLAMNNVNLSAADAQLSFDQAVADAAENLANAGEGVDYLNEKTGEFNQTAADNLDMLNGIASAGNATAQAVYEQTGSYDEFRDSLDKSRESLFETAKAYFPTTEAAWAYVDSVLGIPPEIKTTVDITDNNTAEGVRDNVLLLHDAIQATPDKTVIITEPMSPEIKKKLEDLGYTVETLPDGTIQVTQNGAGPTKQQIEDVANGPYGATVNANANTGSAEAELNWVARARESSVTQHVWKVEHTRSSGATAWDRLGPGGFTGGRVEDIMGFAGGGRVPGSPPSDPTQDNILATVNGAPLKVRSREWIINEEQSDRNDNWLRAINSGLNLNDYFGAAPGLAGGGRASMAQTVTTAPSIDYDRLASAMSRVRLSVPITDRDAASITSRGSYANKRMGG